MKNQSTAISNSLKSMLHLQNTKDIAPMQFTTASTCTHKNTSLEPEEQALHTVTHCIDLFGEQAQEDLSTHMEQLQESFLSRMQNIMQHHGIAINEKLLLSLAQNNTIVLECEEHEETLLEILGQDEDLRKQLQDLRMAALRMRGLDYFMGAKDTHPADELGQFKVCTKGALSHFYLR